MTAEIFPILTGRVPEAREKLAKLAKKAKRYGVPFHYAFGDPYIVEKPACAVDWLDATFMEIRGTKTKKVSYTDVSFEGETPKVGEFEFLASIERTPAGNFVDTVPGEEVPEHFRHTDGSCDHCGLMRRRKHLFVVRKTGTKIHKIVGRTCLRDFLGTDDPRKILDWMYFYKALRNEDSDDGWGGFGRYTWAEELRFLLAVTSAIIRLYGWCSKTAAYNDYSGSLTPTVSHLWDIYAKEGEALAAGRKIMAALRESDFVLADEVIDWVRNKSDDETGDYFHNLRVAFADDVLFKRKRVGLAISAVASYHRKVERELKLAERAKREIGTKFLGEPKERLKGLEVTLESARSLGDNGWGETVLYKFRTEAGELLTWFTSSDPRLDVGDKFTIAATVKKHNEFRGSKETVVTRVTIA